MKTRIFSLFAGLTLLTALPVMAANKTVNVKVKGVCGACENRIETAAKSVDGVSVADWNKETKVMKVTFDDRKTNIKAVESAIAKKGHDTQDKKATNEAYNNLPGCCKYERK